MPLYVYSCPTCEIVLEELRPAAHVDDPLECPICHGLCVREVTSCNTRARSSSAAIYGNLPASGSGHLAGCACCQVRPARRSGGN